MTHVPLQPQLSNGDIWTPITAVVGGISLCFGILKWVKSKQRKKLSYSIVSDTYVANLQDSISSDNNIKIIVGEVKVNNIRNVLIRVRNTGNIAIQESDYTQPLWFFSKNTWASHGIKAYVYSTEPEGIPVKLTIFEETELVGIESTMLNSGDSIFITLLLANYPDLVKVNGRIIGVKEITEEKFVESRPLTIKELITANLALSLISLPPSLISSFALYYVLHTPFFSTLGIVFGCFMLICIIVYIYSVFNRIWHK